MKKIEFKINLELLSLIKTNSRKWKQKRGLV